MSDDEIAPHGAGDMVPDGEGLSRSELAASIVSTMQRLDVQELDDLHSIARAVASIGEAYEDHEHDPREIIENFFAEMGGRPGGPGPEPMTPDAPIAWTSDAVVTVAGVVYSRNGRGDVVREEDALDV